MKKIFSKKIFNRILVLLIIIAIFSIINPLNTTQANSWIASQLGELLEAIMKLLIYIADAIVKILQKSFISEDEAIVEASSNQFTNWNWTYVLGIFIGIVIAVVGVVMAIPTGGASAVGGFAGAVAIIEGVCIGAAVTTVGITATCISVDGLKDELSGIFDIPMFTYTPYAIFSGQVPALDINFVLPYDGLVVDSISKTFENMANRAADKITDYNYENVYNDVINLGMFSSGYEGESYQTYTVDGITFRMNTTYTKGNLDGWNDPSLDRYKINLNVCEGNNISNYHSIWESEKKKKDEVIELCAKRIVQFFKEDTTEYKDVYDLIMEKRNYFVTQKQQGNSNIETTVEYSIYPCIIYIEYNEKALDQLNEYFIKATWTDNHDKEIEFTIQDQQSRFKSSAEILKDSIATWYKTLRRVATVVLLSMLVYVGIRIILSASAESKSKYRKMFMDWLMALCILFVLQYIMVFILTLSSSLTKIFVKNGAENIICYLPDDTTLGGTDRSNGTKLSTYKDKVDSTRTEYENQARKEGREIVVIDDKEGIKWVGEFMGYVRLKAGVEDNWTSVAFGLMYLVLVIDLCTFTFMYIRRVLYIAFLTMIAPLVAVTYPLDKIKDSQAQAFGLWMREYIFNVLLQPLHLIIYTMTISTVMNLAVDYPVYALVALGFMLPAEQFLRKMFGFDRATTVSTLGAMAGGAAVYSGIKKLSAMSKRKEKEKEEEPQRTADEKGIRLHRRIDSESNNTNTENNAERHTENNNQAVVNAGIPQSGQNTTHNSNAKANVQGQQAGNQTSSNNIRQAQTADVPKQGIKFRRRIGNGIRYIGVRQSNKIRKAKPVRKLGKFAGMGIGAATLGTVGLAAGIASGDAKKAFLYTTGGAGVGARLGGTAAENTMDIAGETRESFQKGYEGEQAYNNRKADEEAYRSEEYHSILRDDNIHSELKGIERMTTIREEVGLYRSSGITDWGIIKRGMASGMSTEHAIWAIKLANAIGKDAWNNEETKEAFKQEWDESLGDSANEIWNNIELFL